MVAELTPTVVFTTHAIKKHVMAFSLELLVPMKMPNTKMTKAYDFKEELANNP